ncbi:MAG: guanylate kinase [Brevinema sp.]
MDHKKVIVISGPSGVGKTTMYKKILQEYSSDLSFSISATTRKIRDGESEGKDYYFLSLQEFQRFIDEDQFIEWAEVHHNYYGTLKSEVYRIWKEGRHCLLDLDVQGGLNIQKLFGEWAYLIFILPPSLECLEERLRYRGMNDELSIQQRLANAKKEIAQSVNYDFILKNDDLEKAVSELKKSVELFLIHT